MKIFIDCEFDGHNGKLMSIAAVTRFGDEIYIICEDHGNPQDPWVTENVLPHITSHNCNNTHFVPENKVGGLLRTWLDQFERIEVIADSPVDIARFCNAITTNNNGGYYPKSFKQIYFKVYNIEAYPTKISDAVQHNAWHDARALSVKLYDEGVA